MDILQLQKCENLRLEGQQFSSVVPLSNVRHLSVTAHWSYAPFPIGNLILEVSNNGETFSAIDQDAIKPVGTSTGMLVWNYPFISFLFARLRFEWVSGDGSAQINFIGKA